MAYPYHRIQGRPRAPNPTSDQRPARPHAQVQAPQKLPHRARPKAVQTQAGAMTHHDSLPGDDISQMTHHDTPPGDDNPRMTQNDSLFQAPNPEMTQNDSLCKASMTQNDSHFEVSSFEMTQNDSFSGHKCPTEHPFSLADEPPATPPSPQNDTPRYKPGCDPSSATPKRTLPALKVTTQSTWSGPQYI